MAELTTLAALKEQIIVTGTGSDTFLTNLIARASAFIKTVTRRCLNATSLTEYHDGAGHDTIRLRDWPVVSVASIHESADQVWDGTTLVASTDYIVDSRLGRIIKKSGVRFDRHPLSVRAVYTAGYATIPADLEMACLELCVAKWRRRSNEGVQSKQLGDGSIVLFTPADMTADIRRILSPHMNFRTAA